MTIEELLKKYEPDNYKLIKKPLVKIEEYDERKLYKGSCLGNYPNSYYDYNYWYEVVNADESIEE